MKQWFASLAPRERRAVIAGGVAAALIGAYLTMVEPVITAFGERQQRVARLTEQVEWMRGAAERIERLAPADASPSGEGGERPAFIRVDRVISAAALPPPERLEPLEDGGARLVYEAVAFDPLIRAIATLRTSHGLDAVRARIERAEEAGAVSARLTFEETGSGS